MKALSTFVLMLAIIFLTACSSSSSPETAAESSADVPTATLATGQSNGNGNAGNQAEPPANQPAAPSQPAGQQGRMALSEDYADALPLRNQLTLGLLELETNPDLALTPQQATTMLPLWQVLSSLTQSGTSAQAEIDALLKQIQGELTDEQLNAIAAMQLSRADTQRLAQAWGLSSGTGESGAGEGGPGRNMSEDERATRRASQGMTGESGGNNVSAALLEQLLQVLQARAE
jgi:hypothetical protein